MSPKQNSIKIFTEFLCSVLPDIVSNWELLILEQQQKNKNC